MVKCTGAEWKRFYADPEFWPEDWWHEDEEIEVENAPGWSETRDGLEKVPDDCVMRISNGYVYRPSDEGDGPSLEAHFKRWRRQQNSETILVGVPKDRAERLRKAIKAAGGKVL